MAHSLKTSIARPTLSVVMSVYNGDKYLSEAVESVLAQSYKDFEFIIINDGSTDQTKNILESYKKKDDRIILLQQTNHGLVYSLNRGLETAKGDYIARMDGDDISARVRFKVEIDYLNDHQDIDVVSSKVELIDDEGLRIDQVWPEDEASNTPEQIRLQMPKDNCIAHPAVMARAVVMKQYKYRDQLHGEDYDMWLRMLADGIKIGKVNKVLLKYRLHNKSVTQRANAGEGNLKVIRLKKSFLRYQIRHGKWGSIEQATFRSLLKNQINYSADHHNSAIVRVSSKSIRKLLKASRLLQIKKIKR